MAAGLHDETAYSIGETSMTSATKGTGTEQAGNRDRTLVFLILGMLAAILLFSVWTARSIYGLGSMLVDITAQQRSDSSLANVLITSDGWSPGKLAPAIEVQTVDGGSRSFTEVAAESDFVYVAWDRCPICVEHFPHLNGAAAEIESAPASFAMVVLISEPSDEVPDAEVPLNVGELRDVYGWTFPVYGIDRPAMLELNVQGTPTALILRRGVLGTAFAAGSLDRMTERGLRELRD
jgi:hypothetical protein